MYELQDTDILRTKARRRRKRIFWLLILLLLVGGATGYYYYRDSVDDAVADLLGLQAEPEPVVEEPATAQVRQGDLVIAVGGVGTLLPANELNLGFGTSGIVKELSVQVGTQVKAGDVLATLDDTYVNLQVSQARINLRLAELQLAALTKDPSLAEIADAEADLATARAEYESLTAPPTEEEMEVARNELLSAEQSLKAQYNLSVAAPRQDEVSAVRARIAQAQVALKELEQGPDAMQIAASQARMTHAQAQLDDLMSGPDPDELEAVELAVEQARQNLDVALFEQAESIIESPIVGVVTRVDAESGTQVSTTPIIGVAAREIAEVQFWIEEADVTSASVGNRVNILFEAFPDHTFSGEIVRVEPALVDVEGAPAVQVWASINPTDHPVNLLFGMTADVEVIAGETYNALLVPVQSLRELVPGQFAVFVVHPDGELEMRPIKVGLRDFVSAEVLSGLELGEEVSTGDVETQ